MKTKLALALLLLANVAKGTLLYIDTTTPGTITSSSTGFLSLSNVTLLMGPGGKYYFNLAQYATTNPFYPTYGDLLPQVFFKLNSDLTNLSTAVRTNGNTGNGQIPMSSNTVAGGYAWVAMPSGGGGGGVGANGILTNVVQIGYVRTNYNYGNGFGTFYSGFLDTFFNNFADIPVFHLGGYSNIVANADGSGIIGGEFNSITAGGGLPSFNSYIIGGWSNSIGIGASGHSDENLLLNGHAVFISGVGGTTTIADRQNTPFIVTTPDMLAIREGGGVSINTNTASGFAQQISGNLNVAGAIFTNGVYFAGGGGGLIQGIATNVQAYGSNWLNGFSFYTTVTSWTNVTYFTNSYTVTGDITNADGTTINGVYNWNPSTVNWGFGTIFNGAYKNSFNNSNYLGVYVNSAGSAGQIQGQLYINWLPETGLGATPFWFSNQVPQVIAGIFTNPIWAEATIAGTRNSNVLVSYTTPPFTNIYYSTNSVMLVNYFGPHGGEILWPSGMSMYGESFSDTNVQGDWGFSVGKGMGQILAESGTIQLGATNDVQGGGIFDTISGGLFNRIGVFGASFSTVAGGASNHIDGGSFSFIASGYSNYMTANSSYSFEAGKYCVMSNTPNSFMFNDGSAGVYSTTTSNQFAVHAASGFLINGMVPLSTNIVVGTRTFYITNGLIMQIQ